MVNALMRLLTPTQAMLSAVLKEPAEVTASSLKLF